MRSLIGRTRPTGSSATIPGFDLHALPVAVLVVSDFGLTQANRHWSALTGLSEASSRGDGWLAVVHPEDRALMAACARPDGSFAGGQVRLRNAVDGTEVWVQPQVRATGSSMNRIVVVTMTEIGTLKAAEANLHYQARHDLMTGLLNKTAFVASVDDRLASVVADEQLAVVFFLDLDGFKPVNDRRGHAVGDQLLIAVAERLRATVRSGDLVARLGGDEFAVFQTVASGEDVGLIAERFVAALGRPYAIDAACVRVSASVGVATSADVSGATAVVDASALLELADRAMYRAKAAAPGTWSDTTDERPLAPEPIEPVALTSESPTRTAPAPATGWDELWTDDQSWEDDDADRPPAGRVRMRRAVQFTAVLLAVVVLGWAVRAVFASSSSASAFDTVASTTAGAPAAVHVVLDGDGPAQIAAWLQSIGQGRVYGRTKSLHQPLPVGTIITVANGTVTLSSP